MPGGMVPRWVMETGYIVSKRGRFESSLGLPKPRHAAVPLKT